MIDIKNTDWIKWSLGNRAPFFYAIYNAFIRFVMPLFDFYTIIKSLITSSDI